MFEDGLVVEDLEFALNNTAYFKRNYIWSSMVNLRKQGDLAEVGRGCLEVAWVEAKGYFKAPE